MGVFYLDQVVEGLRCIFAHELFGLIFEGFAESIIERPLNSVDWVLIESDGVEISVQVHISSVGR
jgi:hypothetical protein